jgi:hypothetical protein
MKKIVVYEIFNGDRFDTYNEARKRIEWHHANLLSSITNKILTQGDGKYVKTGDWIDKNLELFLDLYKIKQDLHLEGSEDEDE